MQSNSRNDHFPPRKKSFENLRCTEIADDKFYYNLLGSSSDEDGISSKDRQTKVKERWRENLFNQWNGIFLGIINISLDHIIRKSTIKLY